MPPSYLYPKRGEHGYELQVVEQDGSPNYPVLSHPLASDEERYAAKPGDVVKLIFLYRDPVERNGQTFGAEHMWVRITDYGEGCLIGRLDNAPQFSEILKVEDEVHFHPKHIVRFWSDENSANNFVKATPVCATLFVLSQVPGAPYDNR